MQESLSNEAVFGDIVVEHNGHIVREYPYSTKNLRILWEAVKRYKNLANKEIRGDFKTFAEIFLSGDIDTEIVPNCIVWVVDNFKGLFIINDITNVQATVHIAFFDKSVKDPNIAKEMMKYVFKAFRFQRLTAEIPVYVRDEIFEFVKSVGFLEEGIRRKCLRFDNKWFDLRLYGILQTEVLGTEAFSL